MDGQIREERNFVEGQNLKSRKKWYANGQIAKEQNKKDGRAHGLQKSGMKMESQGKNIISKMENDMVFLKVVCERKYENGSKLQRQEKRWFIQRGV